MQSFICNFLAGRPIDINFGISLGLISSPGSIHSSHPFPSQSIPYAPLNPPQNLAMASNGDAPVTKAILEEMDDKLIKMMGDLGKRMDMDVAAMR